MTPESDKHKYTQTLLCFVRRMEICKKRIRRNKNNNSTVLRFLWSPNSKNLTPAKFCDNCGEKRTKESKPTTDRQILWKRPAKPRFLVGDEGKSVPAYPKIKFNSLINVPVNFRIKTQNCQRVLPNAANKSKCLAHVSATMKKYRCKMGSILLIESIPHKV